MEMVEGLTPEARLKDFIAEQLFTGEEAVEEWRGTAAELERLLAGNQTFGWQAQKLMPHANSCGTLLSRLKLKYPDRFVQTRSQGQNVWTIKKENLQ
jgi:hypothetical protein